MVYKSSMMTSPIFTCAIQNLGWVAYDSFAAT
jgi:hypothetical protein